MTHGTLIFFCGKMGAGKSTTAKKIANTRNAVLMSEDEWLSSLYPEEIATFEDYLTYSKRLKPLLTSHVAKLLRSGCDVVMDFPANSLKQRSWFKALIADAGCDHELIYLNASDETCLNQIAQRRIEQPERAAFDTEIMFNKVTKLFEEPQPGEGFNIQALETFT